MAATAGANIELDRLIQKARKSIRQAKNEADIHACFDWIQAELRQTGRLLEQIEKIQKRIGPELDAKSFNESRDCCQELSEWQRLLKQKHHCLLDREQSRLVKTLDELGATNDGFQRSRKILCNK